MRVVLVPVLKDNYSYLIINGEGEAAAVDPAEPDKVLWAAVQNRTRLTMVLTTHRHWDHAGGNKSLLQQMPDLEIVAGSGEAVPGCTRPVQDGEELEFGDVTIKCLATPYHTSGHMCYLCTSGSDSVLFSGDTLFVGGAGRCFQGTPAQMHASLGVLARLPPEALVYCGHDYALPNLEWAATIDSGNPAVLRKLEWARAQRAAGKPSVPSTIGGELLHNLFLRCGRAGRARGGRGGRAGGAAAAQGPLQLGRLAGDGGHAAGTLAGHGVRAPDWAGVGRS